VIVDGERRLFDITMNPKKKPSVVIGWALDMTNYQELQDKLRRHVSAHSDLLESSSSAMAVYSANTQLQYYNQAFVKLWDLKEEWLDTHPTFSEVLEKLREKRKLPEQADFKAFRDQQLQWFKDLVQPHNEFYYLPDGKELRVIVIPHALGGILFAYEDMTDRLAMERSYNTLLAVQRETLDNLREGIAVFGQNGRLELYNPSYSSLWPYEEEFLKGKPHVSELIEKAKDMFMYDGDWQAFKSGLIVEATQRKNIIRRFSLSNGKCIDSLIIPLPDGRNMQSYMDVTDSLIAEKNLKERNIALEEADRVKTEFLANVSYELRTPLTTILGFSEALENEYFGAMSQEQHAYVQGIYESSSHLMSLINDILDLTSIEAGYLTLDMQEFNMYQAVSSIVDLLQARVKEVGLSLTLSGSEKAAIMHGDEKRIKQVVFNMLSNAIKFTNEGGSVKVGISTTKKFIKVWVEDTGIGIAEDEIPHIFERFYKTRAAQHKDKTGTGLGLSLVKNMVEMHGGVVDVKSEVDKGTTVTCKFPRASQNIVPAVIEKKGI
jgi:signal transduction histidine kinase